MNPSQRQRRKLLRKAFIGTGVWSCHLCGLKLQEYDNIASIDHLIPRSNGGHTTIDNVRLACVNCNNERGDESYIFFKMRLCMIRRFPLLLSNSLEPIHKCLGKYWVGRYWVNGYPSQRQQRKLLKKRGGFILE